MVRVSLRYAISHGKYLDLNHHLLSRTKDVKKESDLRGHMIFQHGITTKNMSKTKMAKYHLLAHALEAFPELEELLE